MGMSDSSPQGGMNWQNTSVCLLMPQDFWKVVQASRRLIRWYWEADIDGHREDTPPNDFESDAISTMRSGLRTIALTPAGLGSRRQSLSHKQHAILHQLYLVSGSPASLAGLLECVTAWTVDLGVESSIPQSVVCEFADLFPYFLPVAVDDADLHDWELNLRQVIDCSKAVVIGGMMHLISNMTKGFLSVMQQWQEVVGPWASSLSTFLRHQWTRERFTVHCLDGELAHFRDLYKKFHGDLLANA